MHYVITIFTISFFAFVRQGESLSVTRHLVCISYIENESRNTSRKLIFMFTQKVFNIIIF